MTARVTQKVTAVQRREQCEQLQDSSGTPLPCCFSHHLELMYYGCNRALLLASTSVTLLTGLFNPF